MDKKAIVFIDGNNWYHNSKQVVDTKHLDFLKIIKEKFRIKDLTSFGETEEYRLVGLPFYSSSEENIFEEALDEELSLV